MMTRKHFEQMAASVEKLARTHSAAAYDMASELAGGCQKDPPRFDRGRFFDACGLSGPHLRPLPVQYVDADNPSLSGGRDTT